MRAGTLFTLAVGGLVALISGASLWRAKTLMERELGVLTPQMDEMASGWEARKVPLGSRVVTLLLSDAGAAFDPFLLAPEPKDGFLDAPGDWLSRNLIGGAAVSQTPTALVRAFSDSTQLIGWTHPGVGAVGEEAMAREVERAILKATAAGAEINIVAQGGAARPVLTALKRVEGRESGGVKAGANKVILLGVNAERLKRGGGFAKPGNVLELASVWSTREVGSPMQVQLFDGKRTGTAESLDALWPGVDTGGEAIDRTARLLRSFTESPETLDRFIARQEARLEEERARKAAEAAAAASAAPKAAPAPAPVAAPAAKAPPRRPAPSAESPNGWPTASVLDFAPAMDGADTGWLFSAPKEHLKGLASEHLGIDLASAGLTAAQCFAHINLTAVSVNKLGPGAPDVAIQKLYVEVSRVDDRPLADKVEHRKIRGFPAYIYRTLTASGSDEKTHLVVDTGRHLIYLVLEAAVDTPARREACVNPHLTLYQGIADSLRPNASGETLRPL